LIVNVKWNEYEKRKVVRVCESGHGPNFLEQCVIFVGGELV
jgi:hypothetical protein